MDNKKLLLEAVNGGEEISLISDDDNESDINQNEIIQEEESVDIDEFLRRGGECGRYQVLTQFLLMITLLPSAYPVMIFYYIGYDPPWKCTHLFNNTTLNHSTTSSEAFSLLCNSTQIYEHENKARCHLNRNEWTYAYPKKTLVTEFDLVCNEAWEDALIGSIVFIGWGIGILVTGFLSDQYGRKKVMFPFLLLTLILLSLHGVVTQIWQLLVIRFLMGVSFSAPALNGFIMVMELVGPSKRTLATTCASFLWPIGALLMSLKAMYIDNWRVLVVACSLPYIIGIAFAFYIPESVRWLNLKGRTKEAENILRKAARFNKRILSPLSLRPADSENKHGKKASYIDLLKRWKLCRSMLAQTFIWFQTGMTYYGLSWAFADLGGNMYVNFILSFVVELPGGFLTWFLMQRIGRKKTCMLTCALTALFCLSVACVPKEDNFKVLRVTLGLTGKFMVNCIFITIYMWSSEIYATVLRTQGMGINIVTSRAGAATSPFIKTLDKLHPAAPFLLMSGFSLIAMLLSLLLPETLNKPTKETLDDMLNDDKPSSEMRALYSLNNGNIHFEDNSMTQGVDEEDREDENDTLLLPAVNVKTPLS